VVVVVVWLYNEVPARRILAVAWLERGASARVVRNYFDLKNRGGA